MKTTSRRRVKNKYTLYVQIDESLADTSLLTNKEEAITLVVQHYQSLGHAIFVRDSTVFATAQTYLTPRTCSASETRNTEYQGSTLNLTGDLANLQTNP